MAIQHETELYAPVKHFFESRGYDVKGEVNGCDLVAMRGQEEPIIVELKKTFNLALLFQGIDRQKTSYRVYLAVQLIRGQRRPAHLRWSNIKNLCLKLGLGLMTVQFYKTKEPHVEILCDPAEMADMQKTTRGRRATRKRTRLLNEFNERSGDYNIGGSTKTKIMTAYRELALQCAYFLQEHEELSPQKLRQLTGKKKVGNILRDNYYNWFERVRHGIYKLTPEGEQALHTYQNIIENKGNSDE